jgi:hypothetical protein
LSAAVKETAMHRTTIQRPGPRLRLLAAAVALAFGPGLAMAQATGATVIHGQASFATRATT